MMNRKFSELWLKEELAAIYEQLKETRSTYENSKVTHSLEVKKLENKIKEQNKEITSLNHKIQLLDPKKIHEAVLEDAVAHYESDMKELYSETDGLREKCNNLHYENAILKCQYDSRESEYSRALEKINLEHMVEVEQLHSKIKEFEKRESLPADAYALELTSSKREVLELNSKIRGFLSECDELRAQNKNLSLDIASLMRSNSKQAADHANNLRTLESEKMKVSRQLEVCEKELSNAQEHRKALTVELQARRQEIFSLEAKLEQTEHNHRMAMAQLQDEMAHYESGRESEQEELIEEINRLRIELKNLEDSSTEDHNVMQEKEQELRKDLVAAKQQFWKLSNEVLQEREKLEWKIRDLESDRDNHIAQLTEVVQTLEQKLRACTVSKMELEKEIMDIRQSMESTKKSDCTHTNIVVPLTETLNYQKEIQDLKEKFQLLAATCNKQSEQRESFDSGRKRNAHVENDHEVLKMKLTWEQQKLHLQQRLEELESQLRDSKNTSMADKRELEFKVNQYTGQLLKLKEKIEKQKEKLESQKEVLEKSVPAEIHLQVKNQYLELQRRLEQYRRLITSEPDFSLKELSSSQMFPNKMLADIKNLDFRSLSQHIPGSRNSLALLDSKKETDMIRPKKKSALSRRRPSKTIEKNTLAKPISPILSSSSDIDWENL